MTERPLTQRWWFPCAGVCRAVRHALNAPRHCGSDAPALLLITEPWPCLLSNGHPPDVIAFHGARPVAYTVPAAHAQESSTASVAPRLLWEGFQPGMRIVAVEPVVDLCGPSAGDPGGWVALDRLPTGGYTFTDRC